MAAGLERRDYGSWAQDLDRVRNGHRTGCLNHWVGLGNGVRIEETSDLGEGRRELGYIGGSHREMIRISIRCTYRKGSSCRTSVDKSRGRTRSRRGETKVEISL